jgi:hypothetical protein
LQPGCAGGLVGKCDGAPRIGQLVRRPRQVDTVKLQRHDKGFEARRMHPPDPAIPATSDLHPGTNSKLAPRQPDTGAHPGNFTARQHSGRQLLGQRRRHGTAGPLLHHMPGAGAARTLQPGLIIAGCIEIADLDGIETLVTALARLAIATIVAVGMPG